MTSNELRDSFLNFFEKKGHKIVPSSSLIPTDPSVLFTTAGMQQFKPYYLDNISPYGKNVCSCQKCFRTSDIEEVGDGKHLTFLEMLGNFSFGGYFKEEAIKLAFDFLFKELKLDKNNFSFTVFEGDKKVPFDEVSFSIWKKLGIPEKKIRKGKKEDNFWGPTGKEGPCGPTTEVYFQKLELWNLVFNEYYEDENKKLSPLRQKGVDTGMGLERLAMGVQNKSSVYETDIFNPLIEEINSKLKIQSSKSQLKTQNLEKIKRVIVDHDKGAVFLIAEGIFPSNVERGYVLRRILRRAIRYGRLLNLSKNFLVPLAQKVIEIYQDIYPEVKSKEADILTVIQNEEEKFEKMVDQGLKELYRFLIKKRYIKAEGGVKQIKPGEELPKASLKVLQEELSGEDAFYFYETFGFPLELLEEEVRNFGLIRVNRKSFFNEFKKHQAISRAGVEKKFGGIGKEVTYETTKLHTATHLLHAALRKVLGTHVRQMGSDITFQRLRFDFSHPKKMTKEEIKEVEELVNQKIKEDLEVKKEEMDYQEAIKSGALAISQEKYPKRVTVYSIYSRKLGQVFSKEICAGPHVNRTSELGYFKIIKEESCGRGIRRIRAILNNF